MQGKSLRQLTKFQGTTGLLSKKVQQHLLLVATECTSWFCWKLPKLHYTQPGISHMILSLEEEFGFPLLSRGKAGVTPTPECRELLPYLRQITGGQDGLQETVQRIRGLDVGLAVISTPTTETGRCSILDAFRLTTSRMSGRSMAWATKGTAHRSSSLLPRRTPFRGEF